MRGKCKTCKKFNEKSDNAYGGHLVIHRAQWVHCSMETFKSNKREKETFVKTLDGWRQWLQKRHSQSEHQNYSHATPNTT